MNELLVGTAEGLFSVGGSSAFEGRTITALSFDGSRPWALVDTREVWVRDGDWRIVATIEEEGASLLATSETVVVGTEGAHLYRIVGRPIGLGTTEGAPELLVSFEDAPGRSEWYTPWGGPPAVRSLAFEDGAFYVNVHVGGILRSTELGTFEQTIDIHTDVHEVTASAGQVIAALGVEGVARSHDGGTTWDITTDGLHGGYVRAVVRAGDALLATASSGPFAHDGAVYRDAGTGFERCDRGLPPKVDGNVDTGWLVARGDEAAVALPDGSLYRSADAGVTWQQVAEGLPEPRWLLLAPNDRPTSRPAKTQRMLDAV